jgi:glutaminyl-tRNA synthetase
MAAPNINMRDPVMYRIIHEPPHHRTGGAWCIYPMYDWAHGQNDSMEGITHSLCSLEYENHRPLYEWFLNELGVYAPRQIEFARLNLSYTVMSKRRLLRLVREGHVRGWDDPRMPTLRGLRRRGYTPEAIHDFIARIGVSKADSMVDMSLLEACVREDLNRRAPRRMAILRPVELVIDNYPQDLTEEMEAEQPEDHPREAQCTVLESPYISRTTSARPRHKSSACTRGTKCACATPISSRARESHAIPRPAR